MSGRINRSLPYPYNELFKNGGIPVENTMSEPEIDSNTGLYAQSAPEKANTAAIPSLRLCALIFIILELRERSERPVFS